MGAFYGKLLGGAAIPMSVVGVFFTPWAQMHRHESIGVQMDFIKVGAAAGTVTFDIRSSEDASPCPLEVSGSPLSFTVAKSSGFIQGSVGKVTWASVGAQSTGSDILVVLVDGETAGAETVTVTTTEDMFPSGTKVTLRTITVGIQSGVTTAAQIKTAMDANTDAAALVSSTVTTSGAMEAASVALSGGSKFADIQSAAPQIRAKVTVTTAAAGSLCNIYMNGKE
jgi:hypothetical protein